MLIHKHIAEPTNLAMTFRHVGSKNGKTIFHTTPPPIWMSQLLAAEESKMALCVTIFTIGKTKTFINIHAETPQPSLCPLAWSQMFLTFVLLTKRVASCNFCNNYMVSTISQGKNLPVQTIQKHIIHIAKTKDT